MTDRSDDPVLTTRAAAKLLGVSVSTAQLWIEDGAIDSWKTPGGHRRVRRSAVMRLLEGHQREAGDHGRPAGPAEPFDPEFYPLPAAAYPTLPEEAARLRALAATGLLDTPAEQAFDRLTWLATRVANTPMAMVSLLSSRRQWFKARTGLDITETPRMWAFCSHAILNAEPFIVNEADSDERFRDNPLVTGAPYIRFYAGFPVTDRDGFRLGTLCVLDRRPRQLHDDQIKALRELAMIASEEIWRRA